MSETSIDGISAQRHPPIAMGDGCFATVIVSQLTDEMMQSIDALFQGDSRYKRGVSCERTGDMMEVRVHPSGEVVGRALAADIREKIRAVDPTVTVRINYEGADI